MTSHHRLKKRQRGTMRSLSNSCSSVEWSLTGTHVTTISALLTHPTGSPRSWMNHCAGRVSVLTRADRLPVKQTPQNSSAVGIAYSWLSVAYPPLLITNLSFSSFFYPVRLVVGLGLLFILIPSLTEIN